MLLLVNVLRRFFITCIFSVIVLFSFCSEQFVFEQLSTTEGLSSGTVNTIFKDSRGFMWFSTDDGLNRFDGYTFKVYNPAEKTGKSDKSLQFLDIVEDCYGTLWLGTSDGLFFFDRDDEKIVQFIDSTKIFLPENLLNGSINAVFYDSRNYLWVGTYNGVVRIKTTENISQIHDDNITLFQSSSTTHRKINNNVIYSINEDYNGEIWIAANSDILERYSYDNDSLKQFAIDIPNLKYWDYLSKRIYVDWNNNLWISTLGAGLIYWDREKNTYTQHKSVIIDGNVVETDVVRVLMLDRQNRIWIGTDGNGLIVNDIQNDSFSWYYKDIDNPSMINSNAIYSLFEDEESNIWIGTYLAGVNKLVTNRLNFGLHYSVPNSNNKLSHKVVTNFCEDHNGLIWISTDGGGINAYNRETGNFRHFKHNPNNKNSLSTNTAITLFCDSDNRIWIGTYSGGLNIYDQKTENFTHYRYHPVDTNSISSDHVWGFEQDKWGNMWIATVSSGLNLMKKGTKSFIRYQVNNINYSGSDQISSNAITHLYIDKQNRLWIATEWGLNMVDLEQVDFSEDVPNLEFNHYINPNYETDISEYRVSYVTQAPNGTIWAGTKGAGLVKIDSETSNHTYYTVYDGLSHNIVSGILFDDKSNLWISTNNGLSNFDVNTKQFKNFDTSFGLQSNFFMKTSCLKASDGTMFFGGIEGFNEFNPAEVVFDNQYFNPIVTDFSLFNQSVKIGSSYNKQIVLEKSIVETNTLNLNYHNNHISFEFSALDFANPEKIFYSYKLDGFDENWQIADANMRLAKYTNLDPGQYNFLIKASSNINSWPDDHSSLGIVITPPWWKTPFFITFAIIAVMVILVSIYYYRIFSLQKQQIVLKNAVDKKTEQLQTMNRDLEDAIHTKDKFFSIVAHDIINPFNSIMGLSEVLMSEYNKMDDKQRVGIIESINLSSNNLFDLLENLLQWSRTERGLLKYTPEKVELNKQIESIISLLNLSSNKKNLSIKTQIPDSECFAKADSRLLNTVLRNLLSNAIKFTPKDGEIFVEVEKHEKFYSISIIDNGIGMSETDVDSLFDKDKQKSTTGTDNEKGTGLGLMLVKEFVEKQNGTLRVKSQKGKGSTFTFTIPIWNK